MLIVVVSERSISSGRPSRPPALETAPSLTAWGFILGRWWESFRLVLLLAIGPAVLAMSLAIVNEVPRFLARTTTDATGQPVDLHVPADLPIEHASKVHLGHQLIGASLLIVTILVHGAGAVGIGLALAIAKGWSRRAIGVGLGFILLVAFVFPLHMSGPDRATALESAGWSFVVAARLLLEPLVRGWSFIIRDILWSVFFWDIVVALGAIGLLWWTGREWQRQSRGLSRAESGVVTDAVGDPPAVKAALIGD